MRILPVVILSTADISAPVWTNKQHIAIRLVSDREVHYIESLGLRSPKINSSDLNRIFSRIAKFFGNLFLLKNNNNLSRFEYDEKKFIKYSPIIIPFHRYKIVRILNYILIKIQIKNRLPKRYIFWSFSPITYGLENKASAVFYHSVDLLHNIKDIPSEILLECERRLIFKADKVIASSIGVADHLRKQGATPYLWENVADVGLFHQMRKPAHERHRRAIFVGNLTPGKIDFAILEAIIDRGVNLALVGPYDIDGTARNAALDRLLNSPLVEYLGTLSQQEMAIELGKSWVGIIPYEINSYTAGVFPMKVYEYLGAGLPIVATALPSIENRKLPGVTVAGTDTFADEVASLCEREYAPPPGDFSGNSWEARLDEIRKLLDSDKHYDMKARI